MELVWKIVAGPLEQQSFADSKRLLYIMERSGVRTGVEIEISRTAMACDPDTLPSPVDDAVRTLGASVIAVHALKPQLPACIKVNTVSVTVDC
jgi:hypothetical protein